MLIRCLIAAALVCSTVLAGCNRLATPRKVQLAKDAEKEAADGNYLRAIALYESALDGTPEAAETHYRLALVYDDKMNDPLNALHHFKRYLTLAPNGKHASEVKNFMRRDELALMTTLSGDSLVTRAEAARLKNENLNLRKQIEEHRAGGRAEPAQARSGPPQPRAASSAPPVRQAEAVGRTYVVESGDTLVSISRKFYKSPARWKEILEANDKTIDDPGTLKVGQTLTIP